MTLAVAVAVDGVRIPLSGARVADVARQVLNAERVRDAMLSIAFVTERAIADLNFEHLGHVGPTDVISFAFAPTAGSEGTVGDVYICPAVAAENAKERGVSTGEELVRLVVHGTLHVLGFDHPEGDERTSSDMWARQERLVARAMGGARKSTSKKSVAKKTSAKKTTAKQSGAKKASTKKSAAKKAAPRRRR